MASKHFKKVVQFDTDYCPSTITKYVHHRSPDTFTDAS